MSAEKSAMLADQETGAGVPPSYVQAVGGPQSQPDYGYDKGTNQTQMSQYPPQQPGVYPQQPGQYPPPGQPYYSQPGQPNTTYVIAPQAQTMIHEPAPPDYMNRAIFATLCCFWPTGICAILKASDARAALARGDLATARTSAQSARQFVNISIIAGVLSCVVACIIVGIYVGLIVNNLNKIQHDYD